MQIFMSQIYYLDLPQLPEHIHNTLVKTCYEIVINEESREWIHNFHRGELTVAAHEHGTKNTQINDNEIDELNNIYKNFFPNEELYFIIGRISNVVGTKSICSPHCDRGRKTAINYLLKSGGDQVYTCFYKEKRSTPTLEAAENRYYKDLTLDYKTVIPEKTWHSYDVQTFHSVEDIENDRFLFSIVLRASNPSIEEFAEKYKNIIKK